MQKVVTIILTALIGVAAHSQQDDIGVALDSARRDIAARHYVSAVATLDRAIDAANAIADGAQKTTTLAALRFYDAIAEAGLSNDVNAKKHLAELFRLAPKARRIDPSKFDSHFISVFLDALPKPESRDDFQTYYANFDALKPFESADPSLWGTAIALLGTREEKQLWKSTSIDQRPFFIDEFWRKRDTTPETPRAEVREEFNRRVVFADYAFSDEGIAGSQSDRGKVLILLGEPARVRRRSLTSGDNVQILDKTIVTGSVEQWVYTKEQLPIMISKPNVTFRFATQAGIGVGRMQREDAYALQMLEVAGAPRRK